MLMEVYDRLVKCDELLPVAANEVSAIKSSSCADKGMLYVTLSASCSCHGAELRWCRVFVLMSRNANQKLPTAVSDMQVYVRTFRGRWCFLPGIPGMRACCLGESMPRHACSMLFTALYYTSITVTLQANPAVLTTALPFPSSALGSHAGNSPGGCQSERLRTCPIHSRS